MGYAEQYDKAVKEGKAKPLTVTIWKFEKVGDLFIGKFISMGIMPDTKFEGDVQRYLFENEQGIFSMILGQATDKALEGKLTEGDLVAIRFQGKTELADGKTVNNYDIRCFGKETGK